MYTFNPQLILLGVIYLTLAISVGLAMSTLRQFKQARAHWKALDDLKLDLADLTERFVRMQKRDGMREARAAKGDEGNLKAELERLALTQQLGPSNGKASLRAQLRKKQL